MSTPKKNYSFRFKEEVMDGINLIAATENRTSTNQIETVLMDFIKKYKRKLKNQKHEPKLDQ
jgi:hypothetical protein